MEAEPAAPAEAASPALPEAVAGETQPTEDESFDFAMPDFDLGAAETETTSAETIPELGQAEDFSIPEFSLSEEGPAPPEEEFSVPDLGPEGIAAAETAAPNEGLSFGSSDVGAEPELGIESALGEDAFESFSFEEPNEGASAGRDLDSEIASLSEEAPVADTFKIDQDWGGFGSIGAEAGMEPPRQAPPKARPAPVRAPEEKFKPVRLTEGRSTGCRIRCSPSRST